MLLNSLPAVGGIEGGCQQQTGQKRAKTHTAHNASLYILSPGVVFAFTLLGLLPLVTRRLFSRYLPADKKVWPLACC
jgi:hypothetical protein